MRPASAGLDGLGGLVVSWAWTPSASEIAQQGNDAMRISHLLVALFLLAGLCLLGEMVWHVGMTDLLTSFGAVGWWMVPWILLESVPVVLHTAGWAVCFPPRHQAVSFWHLALVRLAGSAINQVTPTATLGGELVKVLLLEATVP